MNTTQKSTMILVGEHEPSHPLPSKRRGSLGRFALTMTALATFAFLYVPIGVLILFSFNNARNSIEWRGFTLQWYERMLNNDALIEAAINSVIIATLSTIGATIIGTLTALAMERYEFKGKLMWDGLLYMPVIIPEVVAGVSLLMFFALLGVERGLLTLVIAHIAFSMPFVYLTVRARLADFDRRIEEAAADLGANDWQTFWRITFPLLLPGIISGALLAFTLSIDDFIISLFVSGQGWGTLPIYIWSQIRKISSPEVNAISTVMLLMSIVIVSLSVLLQRRNEK
ncbi:MAG: ABC transporter permease [Anaerolineae bacterium]|nr:ABC transporter permease [Anaerolineae bacterium]